VPPHNLQSHRRDPGYAPTVALPGTGIPLHADEALVFVGIGSVGHAALQILSQESIRIGIAQDRLFWLAIDAQGAEARDGGLPDSACTLLLAPFERDAYLRAHASLRQAIAHVSSAVTHESRASDLPALGLAAFHHEDEMRITQSFLAILDTARARHAQRPVRCIATWAIDDAFAGGVAPWLLFRAQERLVHHRIPLDVFLATTPATRSPHEETAPACVATASAMLWERILRGDGEVPYPGKDGVREDRNFRGPLAVRTWVCAGAQDGSPSAVASVVANCIQTLTTTPVGAQLEAERLRYGEDLLERSWMGPNGVAHPTALLAMNVAGLKLDALPSIVHLRAAQRFLDALTRAVPEAEERAVEGEVQRLFADARLTEAGIMADLGVGDHALTAGETQVMRREEVHGYVSRRLREDLGALLEMGEGGRRPVAMAALLEGARRRIAAHVRHRASHVDGFVHGAVLCYWGIEHALESKRQQALQRREVARRALDATRDRERLEGLLERLRRDTVLGGARNIFERFVATITVSVPTQVRKILEVSEGLRAHALEFAGATLLADIYGQMLHFCARQREDTQAMLRLLSQAGARCAREEEWLLRTARSASTYRRGRFEALLDHVWGRMSAALGDRDPRDVVAQLGGDLLGSTRSESEWVAAALTAVQPDVDRLASLADEILASEPFVREALKEALAQFAPAVQVDRERFANLETARQRFVLCTRRMYEAHRDLFEQHRFLESRQPYAVLFTDHEEGLPFLALTSMRRMHEIYKLEDPAVRASAHAQASLASELPHLDD